MKRKLIRNVLTNLSKVTDLPESRLRRETPQGSAIGNDH